VLYIAKSRVGRFIYYVDSTLCGHLTDNLITKIEKKYKKSKKINFKKMEKTPDTSLTRRIPVFAGRMSMFYLVLYSYLFWAFLHVTFAPLSNTPRHLAYRSEAGGT